MLAGQLGGDTITAAGREYAVGDRIITRRNNPRIGLDNGTRGTISGVDPTRRSVTLRADDGRHIDIQARYLDAGHAHHGYAQTAHLAQGSTAETALIVTTPDDHAAEWTYTASSRVRGRTSHLVLAREPDRQREVGDTRPLGPARTVGNVITAMDRHAFETLAVDWRAAEPAQPNDEHANRRGARSPR